MRKIAIATSPRMLAPGSATPRSHSASETPAAIAASLCSSGCRRLCPGADARSADRGTPGASSPPLRPRPMSQSERYDRSSGLPARKQASRSSPTRRPLRTTTGPGERGVRSSARSVGASVSQSPLGALGSRPQRGRRAWLLGRPPCHRSSLTGYWHLTPTPLGVRLEKVGSLGEVGDRGLVAED